MLRNRKLIDNGDRRSLLDVGARRKSTGIRSGYRLWNLIRRALKLHSLRAMNYENCPLRPVEVIRALLIATVLLAGASAHAQLAISGFAIGQEMKGCPSLASTMRKDARGTGTACKFPIGSRTAFDVPADDFSFATDSSGKIETILVTGIDAVHAAAKATEEYGSPDLTETNERMSAWAWQRGGAMLLISHHPGEPKTSNIILDRSSLASGSRTP
jgi:hypothetical protein